MAQARILQIVEDTAAAGGGYAFVEVSGVADMSDQITFYIRRNSPNEGMGPAGWQANAAALKPRRVDRVGPSTFGLYVGPEIVDHIEGPETVEIEIPALSLRQIIPWPAMASSSQGASPMSVASPGTPPRGGHGVELNAPSGANGPEPTKPPDAPTGAGGDTGDDDPGPTGPTGATGSTIVDPGEEEVAPPKRRFWLWFLIIVAALLVLLAAAVIYLWQTDRLDPILCDLGITSRCSLPEDVTPPSAPPGPGDEEPVEPTPTPPEDGADEPEPDLACDEALSDELWANCEIDRLGNDDAIVERATALRDDGQADRAAALISMLRGRGSHLAVFLQGQWLDPVNTGDWDGAAEAAERYWDAWQDGGIAEAREALQMLCTEAQDRMDVDVALRTVLQAYCQGLE